MLKEWGKIIKSLCVSMNSFEVKECDIYIYIVTSFFTKNDQQDATV